MPNSPQTDREWIEETLRNFFPGATPTEGSDRADTTSNATPQG
ncbi:MAG: hypothetical protein PHT12_03765 [Patescibacteria group bacterium]|nr:hypothetical protein [Patescibacteria group bacterium]